AGYTVGPTVHIVDRLGLADPIASRLAIAERGRPGHEKLLPNQWIIARWSDAVPPDPLGAEVTAARHALSCGPLRDVVESTTAPMSSALFLRNALRAARLTNVRIPASVIDAERVFCGAH